MCTPRLCADRARPTPPSGDDELQEVVVTGIRASLQKSMDIKLNAIGVVDATSVGRYRSVPGREHRRRHCAHPGRDAANRGSLNYSSAAGAPTATGATQGINVRGFGGSFNEVLIEGRPIASGNGQIFNFGDFSAVYVREVDVLKTPDMALSTGTVGAHHQRQIPESARSARAARPDIRSGERLSSSMGVSGRGSARW